MRQPGRSIYADFDRNTFVDFLETLLDKDNFNFYKEVDGRPMISPSWSYCLSYEFELRKEAIRLCKEQSFGIQSALWATLRNVEHRMKHWLQLVAIPNAPSSSSNQELQSLKKRISDLERHAHAHHDGAIRSKSLAPAVRRCSLSLLLLLPHRDRKVARAAGKEEVSNSQQLRVQAKVKLRRISTI